MFANGIFILVAKGYAGVLNSAGMESKVIRVVGNNDPVLAQGESHVPGVICTEKIGFRRGRDVNPMST